MQSRRFEYEDASRVDVWEVILEGDRIVERRGPPRKHMRIETSSYPNEAAARVAYAHLIAEKIAQGYVEMSPADERAMWGHMSFTSLLDGDDVQGLDPNLKLALEGELANLQHRDHLDRVRALHRRYDDRYHDEWSDDYEDVDEADDLEALRDRAIYREVKRILQWPLTFEDYSLIHHVRWSHAATLVYAIDPSWNGEEDYFNIRSLRGIERCVNLRHLELVWQDVIDIAPLAALQALETVSFEYPRFESLWPLATLENLRRFRASGWSIEQERVTNALGQLRMRGIKVEVDFF